MTGDWRRLALAGVAATAIAFACVTQVEAQAPAKTTAAKKAPAKEADPEHAEDGEAGAPKKPAKKKKQDPAEAQRAIDAALTELEAGKSEQAAQALTAVLGGGNLPPAIMAKALLYRGIAYRQQKKPAQAIADLTSALWLKGGLGEADRNDALKQRSSAYQEAGLADSGGPIAPAVPNAARATRTASASDSVATPQAAARPAQASGGWANPFSGWFGGSSSAPSSPSPQPSPATTASIAPAQPPAAAAAAPQPKSSGWTSNTEVRSGAAPAAANVVAAKPEGRFRIQVGMVRTQAEAQALAVRVKREHGGVLATREPEIDEAAVGNMGSFYRVRVGPFASAQEGQATCAKLKGPGIDCLVVAQ
jgi:cell division septation protein DedD